MQPRLASDAIDYRQACIKFKPDDFVLVSHFSLTRRREKKRHDRSVHINDCACTHACPGGHPGGRTRWLGFALGHHHQKKYGGHSENNAR
jgi:hypothetical protein